MTISGPFGGPARRIERGRRAGAEGDESAVPRRDFVSPTGKGHSIRLPRTLVLFETSVKFAGRDDPHPWTLRVTEIYQRAGDRWQRLHRHADPLARGRPLGETLALLAE